MKDGKLVIDKTPNGESPLVKGATPILGCDVWEHSTNARPKYLEAFWDSMIQEVISACAPCGGEVVQKLLCPARSGDFLAGSPNSI